MSLPGRSYVEIPSLEYQALPLSIQQPLHHLLAVEGHEPVALAGATLCDDSRMLNRTKSVEKVEKVPLLNSIP